MAMKESLPRKIFVIFNTLFLTLAALIALIPVIHVFMASFSDPVELSRYNGVILWPKGFSLIGYQKVFESSEIWRGYLNSILYTTSSVALGITLTIFGAYVLSRKGLLWNNAAMFLITFTMIFNGGIITTYLLISQLNWIDSPLSVIVPTCMTPFGLIILRTFFQGIPASLEESANIDGAGKLRIMFQIMVPLSKASIAVVALIYAVTQWNSYFQAMIYLRSKELYPLQLVLRDILLRNTGTSAIIAGAHGYTLLVQELIKYCTIVVSIIPMLIVYPFIQRYFVGGIMIGAIKG